jgi:hypothetical protein
LDPKEISELNKDDVAGFKWKCGNQKSSGIERGKRQGDALSKTLFNIVMEMIRNIETNPNETIFNRMIQHIAYADDVLIL